MMTTRIDNPFATLPPTALEHFKLYCYGAALQLIEQVSRALGSRQVAFEQFPFLKSYYDECMAQGAGEQQVTAWWRDALQAWEQTIPGHLPLRALRQATGLGYEAIALLICIGLIEEDARFGPLFASLQAIPDQRRPTFALLQSMWAHEFVGGDARTVLRTLQETGLIQVINADAPRLEWVLQVPTVLWDVLRGETYETLLPGIRYRPPERLAPYDELIVPDELRQALDALPGLLATGEARALIVRGPQHNGRRTVLGAIARKLECGVLEIGGVARADAERWRLCGVLATALYALPVVVLDLAPGETADLPALSAYNGPLGMVLGQQGGVRGPDLERTLTLTLPMPDVQARRQRWLQSFQQQRVEDLDIISERLRITGGNIRRAAALAQSYTSLAGRSMVTLADVQQASRALNRQVLETLAIPLQATGDWSYLAASAETKRELTTLENRCRHRERLGAAVGSVLSSQLNAGVRALFTGPSGTGKTMAVRLLASTLQMDLYRLDLSSVVNKYIGETEKNLNQVFARAEELDVILLIDEGDALLTRRTNVQTAHDRYANLETNYLLQRLEGYEGILIVTTNALDRIDNAFQRRMDVVVDFRPPDAAERHAIWQLHLPQTHAIDRALLEEVASRCVLTGGQIRNAVLHASLLGLNDGGTITAAHLEAAVQREYRKVGAASPLRPLQSKTR